LRRYKARSSAKLLLQENKFEIGPLRQAKPLIAVRKWFRTMRGNVAPPLVPGDKFRTLADHRHFNQPGMPVLKNLILCRSQQAPPEAAGLKIRHRAILDEHQATNTGENAVFSLPIIDAQLG
jgi:hypothetical protein